ncbi:hypothetical protein [Corallococcus macrosporus]|uniref:Uncharacterized protein n=1 Tax=Corallococcus macrosporus DSM 14697 TaxID=1189310 RepID=A0A250K4X2_9BACT|nr:hypothetical protein [Corallococcus macrosporus]ATB51159.1 hypothetical protein MYMAC_006817 [Corallococcus macrosporus DSM 14697]
MTKNGIAMLAALGVGLAAGFGMAFMPSTAEANAPELKQAVCRTNSDCDYTCGGEGFGHCIRGLYCACM